VFATRAHLPKDIPDGLAETILFAEKYAACSYWALAKGEQTPWYVARSDSGFQYRPEVCDPRLPQTAHRGGMNVALADASVRFVSRSLSPATWFAANTPGGKEDLGSEPYEDW
jgi:prepilin-type processing-associated H-X9-DG protein